MGKKNILLLPSIWYRSIGTRKMLTGSLDKLKSPRKIDHSRKQPYFILVCGL
jgi:hypothetical protein